MTCKINELLLEKDRLATIERELCESDARELVKQLEIDCSCISVKTTKVIRSWKTLWFGQVTTIETKPRFEISPKYKHYITCYFGDLKLPLTCHGISSKWYSKYYINTQFGERRHDTYDSLLKDISDRLHRYTNQFTPGQNWSCL